MPEFLSQFTDPYERKARLEPMLWVLVPLFFALLLYTPLQVHLGYKSMGAMLVYGMSAALLSRIARNAGKSKEEHLKAQWGGWPSTTLFRHSDSRRDRYSKANIHKAMVKAVPGTHAPTPEEEATDPTGCDQIYTAWSEYLRKLARSDQKKFPHVFQANIVYGFWRNLFGLKMHAIWLLVLTAGVAIAHALYVWHESGSAVSTDPLLAVGCGIAILLWAFGITSNVVKNAAETYADRLLDDCVPESSRGGRKSKQI
jgi:hypothetical protein